MTPDLSGKPQGRPRVCYKKVKGNIWTCSSWSSPTMGRLPSLFQTTPPLPYAWKTLLSCCQMYEALQFWFSLGFCSGKSCSSVRYALLDVSLSSVSLLCLMVFWPQLLPPRSAVSESQAFPPDFLFFPSLHCPPPPAQPELTHVAVLFL